MAVTNAVSWRSEGIKHKKNEVFLDVVESVNLLVNSNGTVVLSEVCCAAPAASSSSTAHIPACGQSLQAGQNLHLVAYLCVHHPRFRDSIAVGALSLSVVSLALLCVLNTLWSNYACYETCCATQLTVLAVHGVCR